MESDKKVVVPAAEGRSVESALGMPSFQQLRESFKKFRTFACQTCGGTGCYHCPSAASKHDHTKYPCPDCVGRTPKPCPTCGGSGQIVEQTHTTLGGEWVESCPDCEDGDL